MIPLIHLLLIGAPATAQDGIDELEGGASVLVGTSTSFDGDPATMRLSLRGEGEIADAGDLVGLYVMLPVTLATQGQETFGVSASQTIIELPPSLRLRLLPEAPLRPYGDMGAGLVIGTSDFGGWFFEEGDNNLGAMTRFAMGLEIGDPDGLALIIEPVNLSSYHGAGQINGIYGLMAGLGGRL